MLSIEPPVIDTLFAFWVAIVPRPRLVLAVDAEVKSDRLDDFVNLVPMLVVNVVEKLASFPSASASSFSVSKAAPAPLTKLLTAVVTNAVEAAWVVLVPATAVGTSGVPVNVGLDSGAYVDEAVAVVKYEDMPEIVWYVLDAVAEVKYPLIFAPEGIVTVPVNVGLASGA
jgi:hypothetical protein